MTIRDISVAAAAAAAIFAGAGSAHAATICVNPNRTSCEATVQDAVDAAAAGDTIELSSRTYFENVVIPAGKNGLKIRGKRSAILDPGDDGIAVSPNTGVGITIGSNDVTIRGITIRSGDDDQIEIESQVTGTRIIEVQSINSEGDFVNSAGGNDNTTIRECDIFAPDSSAADISGDGFRFIENTVRQTSSTGVEVSGDDALIQRNTFVGIENGDAIEISGNNAEVVRNKIRATDDAGIDVDGDDALVANNRLSGTYGGIEVDGQRPVVRGNRLTGTVSGGESIEVDCFTDCTGAQVVGNRTIDIGDDTVSFDISASAPGMLIAENVTLRGIDTGFDLSIDGATVRENRAEGMGGDEEDCFEIDGDDNLIAKNIAVDCMGDGFDIQGDANTLKSNRVLRAGDDGFVISTGSSNTTLTNNRSFKNGLTGYRIQDGGSPATGTTLTNNVGAKSRYDICDEGVSTTRSGNDFGSELAVTQDGTQDCPTF